MRRGLRKRSRIEPLAAVWVCVCMCVCTAQVNSYHHPSRWCSPALPPVIDGSIGSAVRRALPPQSLRLDKTVHDTIKHLSPPPLIAPRAFITATAGGWVFICFVFCFFGSLHQSFCLSGQRGERSKPSLFVRALKAKQSHSRSSPDRPRVRPTGLCGRVALPVVAQCLSSNNKIQ